MNEEYEYIKGKDKAIASLILGIVSIVSCLTGIGAIIGFITGIIGLVLSNLAKKQGYYDGIRTGGFVCSLVGLIISVVIIILLIFIVGMFSSMLNPTYYGMYTWY